MWHTQPPPPPTELATKTKSLHPSISTLARLISKAQKGQPYSPLDDIRILDEYQRTFGRTPRRNIFENMAELMLANGELLDEFLQEQEEPLQDERIPHFSPLDFDPKNRYGLLDDKETWACCGEKLGESDGCWFRMDDRDPEGVVLPYRLWTDAKERARGKKTKKELEAWILEEIRPGSAFQSKKYYTRLHEEIKARVMQLASDVAAYYIGEERDFTRKEELRELFLLCYEYNKVQNRHLMPRDVYVLDRIILDNPPPVVVVPKPLTPKPKVDEPPLPPSASTFKIVTPTVNKSVNKQRIDAIFNAKVPDASKIEMFIEYATQLAIETNFDQSNRENEIVFGFANAIALTTKDYQNSLLQTLYVLFDNYVSGKDDEKSLLKQAARNIPKRKKREFPNSFGSSRQSVVGRWRGAGVRLSTSNTTFQNNSCPFDSMLTALFKIPGTWLIEKLREAAAFRAYQGSAQQAERLHTAILSDVEKLQADSNERWVNATRPAWIGVLPLGVDDNVEDDPRGLLTSLFQFYNLENNLFSIFRLQDRFVDAPNAIPPEVQVLVIEYDIHIAELGTRIQNVTDIVYKDFELVSCLSWQGFLHWVSYIKDPVDQQWYYFDALTNQNKVLKAGRVHLDQGEAKREQPCGWIYFRK